MKVVDMSNAHFDGDRPASETPALHKRWLFRKRIWLVWMSSVFDIGCAEWVAYPAWGVQRDKVNRLIDINLGRISIIIKL